MISLIERFTGDYNSLLESLSDLDTDKSANYSKELKSIVSGQSEALQKVGITVDSNGKLVIDEETLKNADKKELKDLFQGENPLQEKLLIKAFTSEQMLRLTSMWTVVPTIQQVVHPQNMSRWPNLIGSYLDSLS